MDQNDELDLLLQLSPVLERHMQFGESLTLKMAVSRVIVVFAAAERERDEWEQSWQAVRQREHVLLDDVAELRDANQALTEALQTYVDLDRVAFEDGCFCRDSDNHHPHCAPRYKAWNAATLALKLTATPAVTTAPASCSHCGYLATKPAPRNIQCATHPTPPHNAPTVRTAGEQMMLTFLLNRIGSWTAARWDQHLRNEYGDERAQPVIDAIAAAMCREEEPKNG